MGLVCREVDQVVLGVRRGRVTVAGVLSVEGVDKKMAVVCRGGLADFLLSLQGEVN